MIDELVMNARGRDAYVANSLQDVVRVTGLIDKSVVAVYDPKNRTAAVGCFSYIRESKEFDEMWRGFAGAETSRLVVKLIGRAHGRGIGVDAPEDRRYPIAVFESIGVPRARIKERHLAYDKEADIVFNVRTGRLQIMRKPIRQVFDEVHDPPEVDKMN